MGLPVAPGRGLTVSRLLLLADGRRLLASARRAPAGHGTTGAFVVSFRAVGGGTDVFRRRLTRSAAAGSDGRGGDPGRGTGIVARSQALQRVRDRALRFARVDSPVMISGEVGTGKAVFARLIHDASGRPGPYLVLRCGSVSEALLDAELFGSPPAADRAGGGGRRRGLVSIGDRGTLVLKDVDQLPRPLQARLVQFLDARDPGRPGGPERGYPDVRIIATTTRDLARMAEDGTFRKDLYYRLSVLTLEIPPLREHPEDIAPLADAVLERLARRTGERKRISPAGLAALAAYPFPGNVRELGNVVEHAALAAPQPAIGPADLPSGLAGGAVATAPEGTGEDLRQRLRRVEAEILRQA
ncbi:MAG TPA: sigma 54-interacting transcriptional regulator, partial [Calidithermus sp.]|nr:sigma 54-interacting transcriptional regulator [Calidithermus sp.]